MKDKELKLEEIEASHTPMWSGGRSCPGEREMEKVHMLLCCRQIHNSHMAPRISLVTQSLHIPIINVFTHRHRTRIGKVTDLITTTTEHCTN